MLQVARAELARFLDLTILKNAVEFKSALLSVSKDTLTVRVMLEGRTFGFAGSLKGKGENEDFTVGFRDLPDLRAFINNFPETIEIEKAKNKLKFCGENFKSQYQLSDIQYIKNVMNDDDYEKINSKIKSFSTIKISKEQLKQITDYFKAVGSEKVLLRGNGHKIVVDLEKSENTIEASFSIKESVEPFEVSFPSYLADIFGTINGDVVFHVLDKAPLGISYTEEGIEFKYFIAPLKAKTNAAAA